MTRGERTPTADARHGLRRAPALVLLLSLLGCVHLSQPAPQIRDYRLDYPPPQIDGTTLPVVLRVAPLRVAAVYDRDAMVYRRDAYSTATSFYSRWSANPGNMLADLIARDLAASGKFRAIQQPPALLASDFQLSGEVEEFEERRDDDGCAAHVRLRVLLSQPGVAAGDQVRLRTTYSEDEPCSCADPRALAASMSRAVQRLSARLQQDVYGAVAATTADAR